MFQKIICKIKAVFTQFGFHINKFMDFSDFWPDGVHLSYLYKCIIKYKIVLFDYYSL